MIRPFSGVLRASLAVVAVLAASPLHAESREVRKTVPGTDGLVVEVENLAGTLRLEAASGSEVEIVAQLHAEGGSDSETKRLLSSLDLAFESTQGRFAARAKYPIEEYGTIHYPDPRNVHEGHGFLSFFDNSRSTVKYQGRRVTVVGGRRRSAPTLYADVTVRLPRGVSADLHDGVGLVTGGDVRGAVTVSCDSADVKLRSVGGALKVKTGSGDVTARELGADGHVETGSGDVTVDGAQGPVSLHTGSGDVVLKRVKGDVSLGTGSGDARLLDVEAKSVKVSTGSGNVALDHVSGTLDLSTGSGDVEGRSLSSAPFVRAETGSGNLTLHGDLSAAREIHLDTSSGDVSLSLERPLAMRLVARTSGGDIVVDVPDMRTVKRSDRELVAEIGGGGVPVSIETSSGNVRVETR